MKRITLSVFSLVALTGMSFGQTLGDAIKKTDNERYEEAAKDFRSLAKQQGISLGDVYFFYGDNYYQADDVDSAKIIWNKGAEVAPENPLSLVGKAKAMWVSGDTTNASALFQTILKDTKRKNAEVIRQIAAVMVESKIKSLNQAVGLLNKAIELEPKSQRNYLLMGDAQVEINPRNSTEAMKYYNKAGDINSNARVFVSKAKIYQRAQNPKLADSLYKVAQSMEPNYAPAYRERAELNMRFGQTDQSINNWKKYLELNDSDYARYRYATSLFLGKKYSDAIKEIDLLHARGFKNMYAERILAYSIYEDNAANNADSSAYVVGLNALNNYFKMAPKDKIIGSDYRYEGLYYQKLNQPEKYYECMQKAAEIDPEIRGDIYGELAATYMKDKNYQGAIDMFTKKIGADSSNLTLAEYYELGRAYYFGPKDYAKADQAHAKVLEQAPTYAMSYLWRARSNSYLDGSKTTWAAKTYYDGFLANLSDDQLKGQFKSMAIEAYKYLGDYYVNSADKNMDKAKEVWGKVQALDPNDAQAKGFFKTVQ